MIAAPYDPRDVFGAARAGDGLARRIVDEEARRIALHVVPIAAVADVALVVLGGGLGTNGDLLLEPVRERLREWLPYPRASRCRRSEKPPSSRARWRSAGARRSTTCSRTARRRPPPDPKTLDTPEEPFHVRKVRVRLPVAASAQRPRRHDVGGVCAGGGRPALEQAVREAGCEAVARADLVDDVLDPRRSHLDEATILGHERTALADPNGDVGSDRRCQCIRRIRPEEQVALVEPAQHPVRPRKRRGGLREAIHSAGR